MPEVADRLQNIADYLESVLAKRKNAGDKVPYNGKNLFGLWCNFCANSPLPHLGIKNVSCKPHVDGKNGALLVCAVFVEATGKCKCLSILLC